MSDDIFRKKSLDRISSPEEIDEYMKVTRPSTWIVLGAIVLLLIAAIIWSIAGRIQTTIETDGQTVNGQVTAHITNDELGELTVGSEAVSSGNKGEVTKITADDTGYIVVAGIPELKDGKVTVSFVTESIAPISFLTR